MNKLEELKKEIHKANEVYQAVQKASGGCELVDDYEFYKELENNYINALGAYIKELEKQKTKLIDLKNQLKKLSEELNKKNLAYYCAKEIIENDKLFKKLILHLSATYSDIFKEDSFDDDIFKMKNGYIILDEYHLIWKSPDNENYPLEDFNAPLVECNWRNLHFKILKQNDK